MNYAQRRKLVNGTQDSAYEVFENSIVLTHVYEHAVVFDVLDSFALDKGSLDVEARFLEGHAAEFVTDPDVAGVCRLLNHFANAILSCAHKIREASVFDYAIIIVNDQMLELEFVFGCLDVGGRLLVVHFRALLQR